MKTYDTNVVLNTLQNSTELEPGCIPFQVCQELFDVVMFKQKIHLKSKYGEFTYLDKSDVASKLLNKLTQLVIRSDLEVENWDLCQRVMKCAARMAIDFVDAYLYTVYGDDTVTNDKRLKSLFDHPDMVEELYTNWKTTFPGDDCEKYVCARIIHNATVQDMDSFRRRIIDLTIACHNYDGR